MKSPLLYCIGVFGIAAFFFAATGCQEQPTTPHRNQAILDMKRATDHHSYSKPEEAVVTHLDWDAAVDFNTRIISATATYAIQTSESAQRILFDAVDLSILEVTVDGSAVEMGIGTITRLYWSTPEHPGFCIEPNSAAFAMKVRPMRAHCFGLRANSPSYSLKVRPSWREHGFHAKIHRASDLRTMLMCKSPLVRWP